MKKIIDDEEIMLKVCNMYYYQHISQEKICKILGLSRPTVSRIIVNAHEKGIVKILISATPHRSQGELEQKIKDKYNLKEVIIINSNDDEKELYSDLGKATAEILEKILRNGNKIGISMGNTLSKIPSMITWNYFDDLTFVSMIGGVYNVDIKLHANQIASTMAKTFKGETLYLYAPAIVSSVEVKEVLLNERSIEKIFSYYEKLDIAICTIGALDNDALSVESGYFDENTVSMLRNEKVIGDICMQFFDENGDLAYKEYNERVVGMNIDMLKKVPYSLGVAGGERKASAVRAALKGGFINTLVTDYKCAKLI